MKKIIEKVLAETPDSFKIDGKMLRYKVGEETVAIHMNLLAEKCFDYCLEYGLELEIFKSRVDELWTVKINEYEAIENGNYIEWEFAYVLRDLIESTDFCDCVFKATKICIEYIENSYENV